MVNFVEGLKRPFSDWKKLGIGFLLYLVPVVNLITGLFAWGFELECARTAMKKKKELPEWNNWGKLFVRGLSALAVSIIYAIPSIAIGVSFMWRLVLQLTQQTTEINALQIFQIIKDNLSGDIIAFALILLLTAYVTPMAIIMYAKNYEFRNAFRFKEVFSKIFIWKYFGAWIFMAAYAIIMSIVLQGIVFAVKEPNFVPIILGAFTSIFVGITRFTIFGDVLRELK
ncbi:MAG: DUF4013 domain-containing protein [DPANN group archaeon]|nr:DUF4013 domain-containing protein [DPANN group archaeon]